MAKKTVLRVLVYDNGTYELSRGSDCDDRLPVKGTMKKRKKKKKKGS